ncbi:hormogonium polysaccharide secretion pseudopilin HpsC [Lyngbya aestuarii]|uniref:hormogonium polysaccharide secretion pseudopilin HpsC n=1 Tax=Lyngbya aestuarii TaxID=118322 RepID=UPI00403DF4DC
MISPLKFILNNQLKLKHKQRHGNSGGFTLIELLVSMILAVLVFAPLLGFMINILKTDRDEQAKSASEQEIQAATDYIAQDLQQAVYIYDWDGLGKPNSTVVPTAANQFPSGIQDQIPPVAGAPGCNTPATCTPVLVFWKRKLMPGAIPAPNNGNNDTYVYSLVAYYLITEDQPTWSNAARIGRFEIRDGVVDPNNPFANNNPNYLPDYAPSAGFAPFEVTGSGNLKNKMNTWTNSGNFTTGTNVLVDYIDLHNPDLGEPPENTPPGGIECDKDNPDDTKKEQRVPNTGSNSFYACVNSTQNYARVYIRGNAVARVQRQNIAYTDGRSAFFPTATIQVKGKSYLPR